jgi:hypothetical protein
MLGNYGKMPSAIMEATPSAWASPKNLSSSFSEGGWEAFPLSVSEGQWAR